jgi:hypothetical protein
MRGALDHLTIITRPARVAAPKTFLADMRAAVASNGPQDAVARRTTQPIVDASAVATR